MNCELGGIIVRKSEIIVDNLTRLMFLGTRGKKLPDG